MNLSDVLTPQALGYGLAALVFAGVGLQKLLGTNRTESDLHKQLSDSLRERRDELRQAQADLERVSKERNDLAEEVGELRGKVLLHERTIARQDARIKAMEKALGIRIDTQPGDL